MKSYNFKYSDYENLKEFIKANNIDKNSNILVQVFSGIISKDVITKVITNIKSLMHQCKIVGISIAVFQNTKIKTLLLKHVNNKNVFYTENMTMLMLSEDNNSRLELNRELIKN